MRRLLFLVLIGCASPAQAMNWEGHDDWMADIDPAIAFEHSVPQAAAIPAVPARCKEGESTKANNPYEQIPLPHHDCRAAEELAEPHP
ncbi:hypothetical protein [Aestuariivirga sp.]|uniref:hypothetical protein n=1 Tax=Aestuariivirga sp. TaxID=2650926 RepID=UPI003BA8983C